MIFQVHFFEKTISYIMLARWIETTNKHTECLRNFFTLIYTEIPYLFKCVAGYL
jgi:hypothetical protein